MKTYKKRQNKTTLGITGLFGVSVNNLVTEKGTYIPKFVAEVRHQGTRHYNGSFATSQEAATAANNLYKQIYGTTHKAKKAGYWNQI